MHTGTLTGTSKLHLQTYIQIKQGQDVILTITILVYIHYIILINDNSNFYNNNVIHINKNNVDNIDTNNIVNNIPLSSSTVLVEKYIKNNIKDNNNNNNDANNNDIIIMIINMMQIIMI